MIKLKSISIENFRGSRKKVDLDCSPDKSVLIYGDNGGGKSSFTDAIDWFFNGKISHLDGEEVGSKGGIRNSHCSDEDPCSVEIQFFNSLGTAQKSLNIEKQKLKVGAKYNPPNIETTIADLSKDNVLIRNSQLIEFILSTKGERLAEISGVIGYEPVLNLKGILKKAFGDIKTAIKVKGFEGSIASEGQTLVKQLGALLHTEEQFIEACNKLIVNLNLGLQITRMSDLDQVEAKLKEGVDEKQAQSLQSFEQMVSSGKNVCAALVDAKIKWESFDSTLSKLTSDLERLKKINVAKLLNEAQHFLAGHDDDNCPVCLQGITKEELKALLKARLEELKAINGEISSMEASKRTLVQVFTDTLDDYRKFFAASKAFEDETKTALMGALGKNLKEVCQHISENQAIKVTMKPDWTNLDAVCATINELTASAEQRATQLKQTLKSPRVEIATKLALGKSAFLKLNLLKKEQEILIKQRDSFEKLVFALNDLHRREMEAFLKAISNDVNDLYLYMHGNERVDDVKLVSQIDEATGEFNGVALSLKFHKQEVSAPKKFLSESYLNSLGLCLFLASVKKFNKTAKFIVFDDVISSFDKNHRIKFANLLTEKFSDYQLIVFTHETDWYEYLASQVKGIGWLIKRAFWNYEDGIYFETPSVGLKEQIEKYIKSGNESDLANTIRRYSERMLKELSSEIDARVAFRFDERNEGRQFDELYTSVKSRLSDKAPALENATEVKSLGTCQFLTNKGSHDNPYKPGLSDMKVAYETLTNFESLFLCENCKKFVSLKYADVPGKRIGCKCGKKLIDWKITQSVGAH